MKKILFVCTGNTCRSPMAEALFNFLSKGTDMTAASCGIYGDGVSPISENAKRALDEKGIEFSHVSTPVSKELIDSADIILGMTENHARTIISMFPHAKDKVYTMPIDISDPYGGDLQIYRNCREQIEYCIRQMIKTFLGE